MFNATLNTTVNTHKHGMGMVVVMMVVAVVVASAAAASAAAVTGEAGTELAWGGLLRHAVHVVQEVHPDGPRLFV